MQLVALRDEDLAADEVDAGDHLGHRVLDLDARVHLDEEELAACRRRAGTRPCRRCGSSTDWHSRTAASQISLAQLARQVDARRDLDDLLVPALDRAVALPEVHEVAVRVAEDLHLDVLGARDVALEEHVGPAERGAGLALRLLELALRARRRSCTTRIPRPPPPKLALMMSG